LPEIVPSLIRLINFDKFLELIGLSDISKFLLFNTANNSPVIQLVANLTSEFSITSSKYFEVSISETNIVASYGDNLNFYYIYPVIFTLGFAGVSIFIRKLTLVGEPVYLIAFYFSICSAIFGLFTLPFGGWLMPSSYDLGLLILIGLFGSIANLLLTKSYQLAEVSLTTPLKYLSLVFAIIFGFYLFNEIPTIYTLSGAGLIVISSAIIFVRGHQLKKPITLPRQQ